MMLAMGRSQLSSFSVAMMSASATDGVQEQDIESTPVESESVVRETGSTRVKREREEEGTAARARKRSKPKIIVLDD